VDLYLVTSQAAERAVRRFQPRARVVIVPPPVQAACYTPPTRAGARDTLGIPGQAPCVLLMSGGWGLGPVAKAAAALGDAGVHVLAVAGHNARLEATLRAVAARQPRVRAFGFTGRVPELMAAADLVITSPGGTCAEARVVGRPLLVLDVLPGHGRDNLQHELELGSAAVTSGRPRDIVASALAALAAGDEMEPAYGAGDWAAAFSAALAELDLAGPRPGPDPP
jgi:UDP-N-acetylglucosamine:LPS N-acetylglucosamine transferase